MLQTFKNGQTSIVLRAKLLDSSSTTGAGLTGLSSASAGLIISTMADNEATATAYTQAGSTIETITTLGTFAAPTATKCRFKEVDSTNHKGVYEFQFADARFAVSSAKSLLVSVLGATNLQQADFVIQLQSDDPYVAKPANFNLTSIDSNGRVDVIKVAGTTQTAGDIIGDTNDIQARLPAALTADGNIKSDTLRVGGTLQTAGDIIGDTNDIQNRLPAALVGGKMDSNTGSMTNNVLTAAALAADAVTEIQTGLSTLDAADVRSAVGMAGANLDTQLAAIGTETNKIVDVKAKTDSLTFTSAGKVDANLKAIDDDIDAQTSLLQGVRGNVRGVVGAASSTTSIVTSSLAPAASVADQFKGRIVTFADDTTTAALRGQATDITANSNVGVLTVTALTTAPASGDTFVIT